MKKMVLPLIHSTNPKSNKQHAYTILPQRNTPTKQYILRQSYPSKLKDNPNNKTIFSNHSSLIHPKKLLVNSLTIQKKKSISEIVTKSIKSPRICPLCLAEIESYRFNIHVNMHPSKIFDWLYLGCYRNASELSDLKKLNMTHVLNCAIECRNNYPREFSYLHLKLCDRPNFRISQYFSKAISFLEGVRQSNGRVLVHCQMGISRSTTCIIAYMIKELNYSAIEALKYIKKKRKIVFPNYGFMEQLIQFEKAIRTNRG